MYRMDPSNPPQLKAFQCYDYFSRLSGFSDLFGKLFVINLKFLSNLIFQDFRGSNINKAIFFIKDLKKKLVVALLLI